MGLKIIKKILTNFRRHRGRLKDFGINSISGIFTGVTIGVFFKLTADTKFNRWINLNSLEIVPAVFYTIFILFVLFVLYYLGRLLVWFIDKNRLINYRLNFFSGICCSIMSFLIVLYHDVSIIRNTIAAIGIPVLFVVAYFAIQK